jgi:hypothetical protein
MMPQSLIRSNRTSNLGVYTKFILSLENLHCHHQAG